MKKRHTVEAFIRKNSKDLQEFAKALGYEVLEPLSSSQDAWICTRCTDEKEEIYTIEPELVESFLEKSKGKVLDCNLNIELWQAMIAAQPDESEYTDLFQYFVISGDVSDLRRCEESSRQKMWGEWFEELGEIAPRKATKKEIIQFFRLQERKRKR